MDTKNNLPLSNFKDYVDDVVVLLYRSQKEKEKINIFLRRRSIILYVVFSTGAILEDNGEIKLYYGAADNCICLGTTTLSEIIDFCKNDLEEF